MSPAGSVLVQYCDGVLKKLPDIKTVIAVRQQLLSGRSGAAKEPRKQDDTAFSLQERLQAAGMHVQSDQTFLFLTW